MKRFFFFLLLLGVGLGAGGKFYYEYQIKQGLDDLTRSLQVLGNFSYHDVKITASGEAHIVQIRFRPHGFSDEVSIDTLALRTGNLMGLYQLEREFAQQRLPQQLGVSIKGLRLLTGGEIYRATESSSVQGSLIATGCGDRQFFSGHDLMDMGLQELLVDLDLDYQLLNEGQELSFNLHSFTRNISRFDFSANVKLGAGSRDVSAIAATMGKAELTNARIHYQDLGYFNEVIKFCMAETGLAREEYLVHHLTAWKNQWARLGLVAGPNLTTAYQNFLEYPDEFDLQLQPSSRLLLTDVLSTPASILIYRVQGKLGVNRKAMGQLDFVALTEEQQQVFSVAEAKRVKAITKKATPVVAVTPLETGGTKLIKTADLVNYQNQLINIRLVNGKQYQGRVKAVSSDRLQFQRYESGGSMVLPIMLRDIAEAESVD